MSTKNDTLFWKEIKEKSIPDKILLMYNAVINKPLEKEEYFKILKKYEDENKLAMFLPYHWWQLLKGCGKYENINTVYSEDFIKYSKMVLDIHSNRMDNVLNVFPNHYDHLTEWYENEIKI